MSILLCAVSCLYRFFVVKFLVGKDCVMKRDQNTASLVIADKGGVFAALRKMCEKRPWPFFSGPSGMSVWRGCGCGSRRGLQAMSDLLANRRLKNWGLTSFSLTQFLGNSSPTDGVENGFE